MTAQPRMTAAAFRAGPGRARETAVHVPALVWVRQHVSAMAFHVENERKRNPAQAAQAKRLGLMAGVHDIIGPVEYGPMFGRWFGIEIKREGSTESDVTDDQRRFGRMLTERGGLWMWADDVEDVKAWAHRQGIVKPAGWRAPWAIDREEFGL